jgi:hypothetical protein
MWVLIHSVSYAKCFPISTRDDAQCFVTGCERCVRWLRAAPNRPAFRVARVASDNGMSGDADMTAAIEAPTEHRAG